VIKLSPCSLREDLETEFILILLFLIRYSKMGLFAFLNVLGQFVHLRYDERLLP